MYVRARKVPEKNKSFLTAGKLYSYKFQSHTIEDDEGDSLCIHIPKCVFLDGDAWEIVNDDDGLNQKHDEENAALGSEPGIEERASSAQETIELIMRTCGFSHIGFDSNALIRAFDHEGELIEEYTSLYLLYDAYKAGPWDDYPAAQELEY